MAYVFVEPGFGQEGGWLALLLALSVKGALILVTAAIITFFLRRAAAASRHLVWGMALASLLALPLLSAALPAWQWPVVPDGFLAYESSSLSITPAPAAAAVEKTAPAAYAAPQSPASGLAKPDRRTRDTVGAKEATEAPSLAGLLVAAAKSNVAHKADSSRSLSGWVQWATAGWLIGIMLIVVHLLVGSLRIWQFTRRAEPVRDAEWLRLVDNLSRRIALTQTVDLRRSARVTMPMACGLLRSAILLPADADDWSRQRREVVLLHELAHVKRRDCLTQLFAQAACAIYWFNPLVWLAARRLRIERERACDDQVLDAGAKASDYADHLLDIARSMGATPTALVAAVAIARRSQLEGRLLAILDPRLRRRALNRSRIIFIALVLLCLVLPLAMLRPAANAQTKRGRAAAPKPPAAPQAPAGPTIGAPAMAPMMAAPPEAAIAPVEPGAPLEAALAPPAEPSIEAPALEAAPAGAPAPAALPAPAAAPQAPASPQSPISQQDRDAAVEAFINALKDDDAEMREQALFALAQIGGPRATDAIMTAAKDANPQVRAKAVWALAMRHGDGLVDVLLAALKDANVDVREKAAWALGLKGDGRSVNALVAALRDESDGVRQKAAWALGMKGNSQAVDSLIEALKDKNADVRGTAAWALGMRGDTRAIKPLNAAAKADNRDVRSKALWALGMLLMRRGESVSGSGNDNENENDNDIEVDLDGKVSGGVAGGVAGGIAGGIAGGVAGGVRGGVAGGVAGGLSAAGSGRGSGAGAGQGVGAGVGTGVSGGVTAAPGRRLRRPGTRGASGAQTTPKQP